MRKNGILRKMILGNSVVVLLIFLFLSAGCIEGRLAGQIRADNGLEWSYLDNGKVKIGVIKNWGAGVAYFSRTTPARNLVNYYDQGREVQQSYYGNTYTGVSCDGWDSDATWNPVQAGDLYRNPSSVLSFINDGTTIYAKVVGKDWCLNNVDTDGYMEEWITLMGDVAKIHFKFTYTGNVDHELKYQEVPAMFFDLALGYIAYYDGNFPWTGDAYSKIRNPDSYIGRATTEKWMAAVDGNNWGIGAYVPGCAVMTPGHTEGPSGPTGYGCTYIGANINKAWVPGDVYEYDVYLTIGTIDEIRSRFHAIVSESARCGGV